MIRVINHTRLRGFAPPMVPRMFWGVPQGEIPMDPKFDTGTLSHEGRSVQSLLPPVAEPSDFERSSWGPRGEEYGRFRLAADCELVLCLPADGSRQLTLEIITGFDSRPEGQDTRRSTPIWLTKSRARALASTLMGAAAEV